MLYKTGLGERRVPGRTVIKLGRQAVEMGMAHDDEVAAIDGFATLGLDPKLLGTLTELGYEEPTPIQREAIPALLTGRDLIGQAATGTGKTAAFALPMLQRVAGRGADRPRPSALILVPTRELAMQVAEAMHKYGQKLKTTTLAIYGGSPFGQQQRMLERGVDVVVATPGRAVDHIRRQTLDLSGIAILALDEADEMLDMGFAEDLETILSATPAERQTVFFSATLPPRIAGMVKRHLRDPIRIEIQKEKVAKGAAPKVRQTAYVVPRFKKLEALGRVLDLESPASALVFCRTRTEVDNLTERLSAHGYRAQALHGGIAQDQRTRVIKRLRDGAIDLVVATDVAARGLDIEQLELVVNYDVPVSPDSYLHRIGRVGRAGREGVAITLADPRESRLLRLFERHTKGKITIAQVPTVADLRARRMELTRVAIQEAVVAGGLEPYRGAVESLAREHDLMSIALAAMKLAHKAAGGDGDDGADDADAGADAPTRGGTDDRSGGGGGRGDDHPRRRGGAVSRVYVGAGRIGGVRPQDLVAAITGQSGIRADQIGKIEIEERFSIIELSEGAVEPVLTSMRNGRINGRKVNVRRFVEK
jgi:ATP-dependent RNA helicase DeaD